MYKVEILWPYTKPEILPSSLRSRTLLSAVLVLTVLPPNDDDDDDDDDDNTRLRLLTASAPRVSSLEVIIC